jgi:TRAP-type mannitol/chloroaromatic compound transport system substrate-binding protein
VRASNRTTDGATARRRFLVAAAAGAATLAAPQVSRAQTTVWRFQSAWGAKDIFHEFAAGYAKKVAEMTGGRLTLDLLAAGTVVPPFQMQDAVHAGILDGAHASCDTWQRRHKAFLLFGCPPSFGWDSHSLLAWFYQGGGEALYQELVGGLLKLNVTGWLYFPMPAQPLGWFTKEVRSAADLKGLKVRTVGLAADLFKSLGAAPTQIPNSGIINAMERDLLDGAEINNPSSDMSLGLAAVAKVYMLGSHHRPSQTFEVIFNKAKFDPLSPELKAILRNAALAASSEQLGTAYDRYSKDLAEIKKRGVSVVRTGEGVLAAQLAAWDEVIEAYVREPFFAKVLASQKAWVKRTQPYLLVNNLSAAEAGSAYKHFFG